MVTCHNDVTMGLSELHVRPLRKSDIPHLDNFRERFKEDGEIALPFGYSADGVETAVAEKNGKVIGAVTATKSAIINFMKDPDAAGKDIYAAVLMLERALTYVAEQSCVAETYCAIPAHLTEYIDMVKRSGYTETFQNCVVLRRPLAKELTPEK